MNITHVLTRQATERPGCVAIVDGVGRRARRVTFAELVAQSAAAAAMLRRDGLGPGDRVLILVPMSVDLYVALIAVFRLGAVATFLDPSAGLAHVTHCCRIAGPAALIGSVKVHLLRLVSPAIRRIRRRYAIGWPVPGATRWSTASTGVDQAGIADVADDAAALLTFTSGSTGQPKAAVRSHGFLAAQHDALAQAIELRAGEVDLATLPIFALANLASGVTTLIPKADLRRPRHVKGAPILRQAQAEQATRATASPAFFERLLDAGGTGDALAGFTRVYTGGAPVFPGLLERLQRAMPAARVVAVYGSTEAEPIAHVAWDAISTEDAAAMFAGAGLLAGPPVPHVRLRILPNAWGTPIEPMTEAAFESMALPAGDAGEIVVQGDHVLRGYLHGSGDDQTKLRVGDVVWHRTGDAGYVDGRGRLWLLGRAEARIADDRGTIYPFAVECFASRIEGISRAALVQHHGRRVLVIQPKDRRRPVDIAW
ncbi:MAG: AMP-binding protein, partial [Actinomycetota bacterium]|nr:AMP-binding protein [Actinomycetota bacterium]